MGGKAADVTGTARVLCDTSMDHSASCGPAACLSLLVTVARPRCICGKRVGAALIQSLQGLECMQLLGMPLPAYAAPPSKARVVRLCASFH